MKNNTELSEAIARKIMEIGDEPNSPTQRLSFVAGEWPDNEIHQGGIAEYPLAKLIEKTLDYYMPSKKST